MGYQAPAGIYFIKGFTLDTLNRLVTIYLDFAELQALGRKPMYMKDWINKLDEFLKVSERDILRHAGIDQHPERVYTELLYLRV